MPRYDYRCVECSHEFELVQTFAEAGTASCPQCSSAGRRLFHAVPVIYKGSGFYTTDYGRPKPPAENGNKESSESKTTKETSSDSSTESASKSKESTTPSEKASATTTSDSKSGSSAKTSSDSTA